MRKFRKSFVKMFNEPCENALKAFKEECFIGKEKREFYELKKELRYTPINFNTSIELRQKYDRMRYLGRKYDLVYNKRKWAKG